MDWKTLEAGSRFTFDTPFGALDILHDPDGAPPYEQLFDAAGDPIPVESIAIRVASLDHLIALKEASGRTKDKLMATEYRTLSDVLRAPRSDASG